MSSPIRDIANRTEADRRRCEQDEHPNAHPAMQVNSSGDEQVCVWCPVCERPLRREPQCLPERERKLYLSPDFARRTLAWDLDALPRVGKPRYHLCRKCREWVLCEFHHIAPRAVFNDLADIFPVVPLCRPCHVAVEAIWRTYLESWKRAA